MKLRKLLFTLFISILIVAGYLFTEYVYSTRNKTPIRESVKNKVELFLDKRSNNPTKYSIRLSNSEIKFLTEQLKSAKNYLEFGSGGSTYLAVLNSDAQIVSIESDEKWLDYMREWDIIKKNEGKRLTLQYINIGPIKDWGYPADFGYHDLFPNYSSQVFQNLDKDFDVIFVDGRFRVACTLQTILHTKQDAKILMHDFTYRPQYKEVLRFLDIEKTVDTMVLFKKKKNINLEEVKKSYEKYKYNYE